MSNIKRIWHNFNLWEDYKNGFYSKNKIEDIPKAIIDIEEFFYRDDLFFHTACEVMHNWKYCIEYNLSNSMCNRVAYLGQVSVNYMYGYPSYFTSKCFSELNPLIKNRANKVGLSAVEIFEQRYYNPSHPKIVRIKNEKLS